MIDVIYRTFNRKAYTMLTLPALYTSCKRSGLLGKLIVVDNLSNDGTEQYITEFAAHFQDCFVLKNRELASPWKSFLTGLEFSNTEFVAQMDNDRFIDIGWDGKKNWLTELSDTMLKFPKLGTLVDEYGYRERKTPDRLISLDGLGYYKQQHVDSIGLWRTQVFKDHPDAYSFDPCHGCPEYQDTITDYDFGYLMYGPGSIELDAIPDLSRLEDYAEKGWARIKRLY